MMAAETMRARHHDPPRAARELALVLAAGALAGLLSNAVSPRGIPLLGDWTKPYGVRSAGGVHAPTYGNVEIGLAEAARLLDEGALFLDARPAEEYAAGHIPGAASFPEDEADERIEEALLLCGEAESTVVYCAGIDCDEAHLVARRLREAGVDAVRVFAGGLREWRAAGRATAAEGAP